MNRTKSLEPWHVWRRSWWHSDWTGQPLWFNPERRRYYFLKVFPLLLFVVPMASITADLLQHSCTSIQTVIDIIPYVFMETFVCGVVLYGGLLMASYSATMFNRKKGEFQK